MGLGSHAGPNELVFQPSALVTFGDSGAVLPCVYQIAVEQFAWVTATQMMDGLAIGETTPEPLVESTTCKRQLTATLTAIIVAVVGRVSNFSLYLKQHVYRPQSFAVQPLRG